jgi:hypothetical protein
MTDWSVIVKTAKNGRFSHRRYCWDSLDVVIASAAKQSIAPPEEGGLLRRKRSSQ